MYYIYLLNLKYVLTIHNLEGIISFACIMDDAIAFASAEA